MSPFRRTPRVRTLRSTDSRRFGWPRISLALVLVTGLGVSFGSAPAEAALQRDFSIRYQADVNGAIDIFGNTLLTCPGSCAAVQNPSGLNTQYNNSFTMTQVDVDGNPATFNSSATTVTLPAGARVEFAGLYWGAQSPSASRNRMSLRLPGGAYQTVVSSQLDVFGNDYQAFADVTALIRAGGSGQYWGANVQAQTGSNTYAGWSLVIAYSQPSLPLRNLTVFDGYGIVRNTFADRRVDIPITGFLTPPFGAVNAEVGVIAYEGDGGISGDQFLFNNVVMSNAQNPANDFFNSTISTGGVTDGGRTPNYQNTLGYDADEVDASGILANSSTSTTITLTTTGDAYFPGVVTTQIDLYAPEFPATTKTVVDLNGGTAQVGDVLRYSVLLTNVGLDPAASAELRDSIPSGTSYVGGSLVVNGAGVTDAADTDVGRFTGSEVRANVGVGATGGGGGTIGPNGTATVSFDVRIELASAGQVIDNTASLIYVAQTLNRPFTFTTNPVSTPVDPLADLSVAKRAGTATFVAGSLATYTIDVVNNGPNVAPLVTVNDVLPAAFAGATVTTSVGTCSGSSAIACSLGSLGVGATATITVSKVLAADVSADTVLTNTASVRGAITDSNLANNTSTVLTDVDASADLRIAKSATPGTVTAGGTITYLVTVTNDGPSVARAVTVNEVLPAEILAPVVTPSIGTCGGTTCALGDLAVGASATLQVVGSVSSSAAGSISNSATTSGATPDPVPSNNAVTLVTPVLTSTDLSVTKTASPSPAVAGRPVTYTVVVTNNGPSDARGVVLDEALPVLTNVTVATNAGSCSGLGPVSCALGTVVAGASVTITISGTVPSSQTANLSNTATVSTTTTDSNASNDSVTVLTPVTQLSDLTISKTASPDTVVIGSPYQYVITVRNLGPSTASAVVVSDTLPTGAGSPVITASQGACTAFPCELGDIPIGGVATITIDATAVSADTDNTATVTSPTPDPTPSNNTATVLTTVTTVADLGLEKQTDVSPVLAGTTASWTITATNDGPSPAGPFDVSDVLDAAFTPTAATIEGNPCVIVGQAVTCSSPGLPAGASVTIIITADVDPSTPPSTIVNAASITNATTVDPTSSNDAASSPIDITTAADLRATKTADTNPITPGLPATFTIGVSNAGPSDGAGVLAVDILPVGWTLDPTSDPRCTLSSGVVDCDVGVLSAGTSTSVALVVIPPPGAPAGPFTNSVTVSSDTPDPTPDDNTATANATIIPVADLSVTKTETLDPAIAGEPIGYVIEVTNAGPSDATTVMLSDPGLAVLDNVTIVSSQGTCDAVAFTCSFGTITAGSTVVVNVTGGVPAATAPGVDVLVNTVTVTAPADTSPGNNSATELTTVERSADLVLSKAANLATAIAGDPVTWTLAITNQGPSDATNVVVSDTLPPGLVLSDAVVTTDAGTCVVTGDSSGGALDCQIGDLAADESVAVTLTAQVDPTFTGSQLVNTASVVSDDPDDNPSDNIASVDLPVVSQADLTVSKAASNPTPVAGESVIWIIQVSNAGPSAALDVQIDDTLPPGFVADGPAFSTVGTCDAAADCSLGDLAVGDLVTITVSGTIDSAFVGSMENSVVGTSSTTDPAPADNSAAASVDVQALAALSISKVADLAAFTAGSSASWTITVSNAGPSDAVAVAVTDVLPATGLFGATATPSQGSCATASSCALGTIAAGDSATIVVSGTISPAFTATSITNSASVRSSTPDPDPTDDSTSVTVPVAPVADLSVVKRAIGEPFVPGADVVWEIVVANGGPSNATAVTVTDTLPGGAVIVSATATSGSCSGAGGVDLTCDLGVLAAGGQIIVTVTASLPAGTPPGTVTNSVTISSDTADPNAANNTTSEVAAVRGAADLVMSKTTVGPVVAGQTVTWDLTVTNNGPSDAFDVVATDSVPSSVTVSSLPAGCSGTTIVTCTVASIASGASTSWTISGLLSPDERGLLRNSAAVTSSTADPDTSNNEAATIDVIDFTSNVVLTKVAPSPAPVPGGAPGRWTITLVNNGPSTANDVVISDAITTSTPVVDVVLGSAGTVGACDTDVTCTIGDLPPGTTVTVLIDVEYPADATPGLVTNTATVTGNNLTGTTSADADFVLLGTADLVITKEVLPDSNVLAGVSATYRIRVENIGPSDAEMVEINDLLPAAALAPSTAAPGCVASVGDLTCLIGTLAAGAAVVVDVDFTADPGAVAGDLDNTAIVISSTDDPNAANNTATVTTGVSSVADLRLIKSVSAGPYVAGAATTHTYQVQIDNAGPSTATGVTVTDSVPAGLTISGPVVYSVGALSGSCSVVGNDVSCPLTDLPPGVDVASVQIPVTIDSDTPAGPIINAAVVTAATADPSADNNTDTASLTVVRTTTVTLAKSGVANGPAGTTATWTITGTVDGPSSAEASTVSDTLPIGFTPTSATGTSSNGPVSCTISGRLLSCPLGDLLPGASFEITVDTTIAATVAAGVYPNTANFSTITPNGSTSAQGPVTIERNAPLVVTKATVGTGPFTAGEPLDWTIVVTNPGPSTSENVVVEELVPVGYTVASLATTSGSCTTTTSCTLGNLSVGGTATITVRGTVDADTPAGSMTNTVGVTSDTPGAPPPVSADATIEREVSLVITKRADPVVATAGAPLTWTIEVTNEGPSTATNVTVSDVIPAELLSPVVTPQTGTWSAPTWTVPSLLVGQVTSLTIVGTIDPAATTPLITNTATLQNVDEPNLGDVEASVDTPLLQDADLVVTKQTITSPIVAGASVTWEITVDNLGPSDATVVSVTDVIPATVDPATVLLVPSVGTCDNAAGTCDLGTVTVADAPVTITVVGTLAADTANGDLLENTVEVTSFTFDGDLANNQASTVDTVTTRADLMISKAAPVDPLIAGNTASWVITVANPGPSDALDVEIIDQAPAELLSPTATSADATCTGLTCTIPVLSAGQTVDVTVSGTLDPSTPLATDVTNRATVTSPTDPATAIEPKAASVTTPSLTSADLRVRKQVTTAPVAGEQVVWTVTVFNDGPSDATTVTASDLVPSEVDLVSVTTGGASCTVSACVLGPIANGASATFIVTADVPTDVPSGTTISNTASASSVTSDPDSDNNTDAVDAQVTTLANLSIVKEGPLEIVPGTDITWTITVSNAGPSDAQNGSVADTLPANVTLVSTNGCAEDPSAVPDCTLGVIGAGLDAVYTITATVDSATTIDVSNSATVTSDTPDPDVSDNTSGVDTAATPQADLSITKSIVTDPVIAGEPVEWTITVTNAGPSVAIGVTADDTLPATVSNAVLLASQGTCGASTCALGDLLVGASATITVTGDLDASTPHGSSLSNQATTSADTADPDTSNNTVVSEAAAVTAVADLAIVLTAPASAVPGTVATWLIDVSNLGPSDAQSVVVTFPVPAGVSFTNLPPGCVETAGVITCTIATLPNGGATQFILTGFVDPSATAAITSQVTVASDTTDPQLDNNVSVGVTELTPGADLSVTKTGPTAAVAGTRVVWQLVVMNAGPSTAVDVVLTDVVPVGVSDISVTDEELVCELSDQTVSCTWPNLEVGGSRTVTISGFVAASYNLPTLANSASLDSATPDLSPDDNVGSAVSEANGEYDLSVVKTVSDVAIPYYGSTVFSVQVSNLGPSAAAVVVMRDSLPPALELVGVDTADAAVSCTTSGQDVECVRPTLGVGESFTVLVTVRAIAPGRHENLATVVGRTVIDGVATDPVTGATVKTGLANSFDVDSGNNADSVALLVDPAAELIVTKQTTATGVIVGDVVTWVVTVANIGPSDATSITVTERPGTGLTITRATPSVGAFDSTTSVWSIPRLPSGSTATLRITSTPTQPGTAVNAVEVDSATPDAAAARAGRPGRPIEVSASATIAVAARPVPATGADSWPMMRLAILLMLAGGVALAGSRRGRSSAS